MGLGCGFGFPGCGGGFGSFRRSARRCLRSFVAGGFGDMAGGCLLYTSGTDVDVLGAFGQAGTAFDAMLGAGGGGGVLIFLF